MQLPLIIGNWKMRLGLSDSEALAGALVRVVPAGTGDVVVCPSFPCLTAVSKILASADGWALGAQDAHYETSGAFTGAVSPVMLKELDCRYVLVGHSERRRYFAESDEIIGRKVAAVAGQGLIPVVCIGENAEEKQAGREAEVMKRQIEAAIAVLPLSQSLVVAYEPVWAISDGAPRPAEPDEASRRLPVIREALGLRASGTPILYGGSVTATDAAAFVGQNRFDGVLVGAASVEVDAFASIVANVRMAYAL